MKRAVGVLVVLLALASAALATPATASVATARPKWSPGHYTPGGGPRFNNPLGDKTARRTLLRHVNRTIMSVRGYRVRDPRNCPTDPARYPAEIKISLYSIADIAFVDRLIAANRRCISVQLLMNDHLDETTSPSWSKLVHALGGNRKARSFAYRCTHSCRGNAILHSKFYLFSQAGKAHDVVMVGSSNMTTNASGVQWNDLYTVAGNRELYDQFRSMFRLMVPDRASNGPRIFRAGMYTSTFYPFSNATAATDRTMRALNSIHCTGATGGTGINGRTVLYVNMHAWHGTRGRYLAQKVRRMYDRGCYVRILYSFMGRGTYDLLTRGTGSRMVARRTLFPRPDGRVAAKYSHMKMFAASGNIGTDSSARVVWTGSMNFGDTVRSDEVTLRIPSGSAYAAYIRQWQFIRRTHSAGTWATYEEPGGGGRAPN